MAVDHYENFPVASWLLPARLRAPVAALYAFARGADDIADEGEASDAERLAGLARYDRALDEIEAGGTPPAAPFARLARVVRDCALPVGLLRDLVDAFRQDVTVKRYASFGELLDYSRRSADPVGRLVLHIVAATEEARERGSGARFLAPALLERSDAICSALQLANFWQDVAIDWEKGRVYVPQQDLAKFGVDEGDIAAGRADGRWAALMRFECQRAREMLAWGAPLGRALPGRIGLEIRATVAGGARILDRIDAVAGDVFRQRPVLRTRDWATILVKAL